MINLETNNLKGALPDVSFNNPDELGKGKELVDKFIIHERTATFLYRVFHLILQLAYGEYL